MSKNKQEHSLLQIVLDRFHSLENARALAIDSSRELLSFLLEHSEFRERFFTRIEGIAVFEKDKFLDFLKCRELNKSYTAFSNKIGLQLESSFENTSKVVLNFPFKDCVLKGGQSRDEQKSKEIFFNEILEKSRIDVLFSPKVLQNFELVGHSACGDFLGNAADTSLRRMSNTPHSLTLHNPKNSLTILECQDSNQDSSTQNERDNEQLKDSLKAGANLLIKGNNLLALHSLKKKFANKVKLIYIDPPYNTGNDSFNYNDNFNHSTWLTFMKNRLEIAREFLRDDGVIFIQCDDNEQAYLKVLCDEIFNGGGGNNFVGCMVWLKGNAQNDADTMQRNQEYILCYAKNIESKPLYRIKQKVNVKAFRDEKTGRFYYEGAGLTMGGGDGGSLENRPNLGYTFYYNPQTNDIKPLLDYDKDSVKTITNHDELYNDNEELIKQGYVPIRPPKMGVGNGRWKKRLMNLIGFLLKLGKMAILFYAKNG